MKTLFYPNGSSTGFAVSSRNEILTILREKADNIVDIDIQQIGNEFKVLARMNGDASWFNVGKVDSAL
jgi:hypothetical protein